MKKALDYVIYIKYKCQFVHLLMAALKNLYMENSKNYKKITKGDISPFVILKIRLAAFSGPSPKTPL